MDKLSAAALPPIALRLLVQGHGDLGPSYQPVVENLVLGGKVASAQPCQAILDHPKRFAFCVPAWSARLAECCAFALGWNAATACWYGPAWVNSIRLVAVIHGPHGGQPRLRRCSWNLGDGYAAYVGGAAPDLPTLPQRVAELPRFFAVLAALDDAGVLKARMEGK